MEQNITSFHLMAKPIGAKCNLNCEYCYFLEKEELYKKSDFRMNDAVLESYIKQYINAQNVPHVMISWQGGEPTIIGLDFYKKAVQLIKKYKKPGMIIEQTMQTNGTYLTKEWCDFFRENNFLIGLSIDGPRDVHDVFRKDKSGKSVFESVVSAVRMMQECHVDFNLLTTINSANVDRPLEIYKFLKDDLGGKFIHFIPVVEHDNNGQAMHATPSPMAYGRFINVIFDEWIKNDVGDVFIDLFDMILAVHYGVPHTVCVHAPTCGTALVLEHTGDVYSCDHFVEKKHLLGNILETPLVEMVNSDQQKKFGMKKLHSLSQKCLDCDARAICHGGCPKGRFISVEDEDQKIHYLCEGYKEIFYHTYDKMQEMSVLLKKGQAPRNIMKKTG